MPAFLTHWRVLIETARRSQDAGSDLGSLIIDVSTLKQRGGPQPPITPPAGAVWNTGPMPHIDFHFPGSDISAMAYLGALAPDLDYFQPGNFRARITSDRRQKRCTPLQAHNHSAQWAELLHANRSGDVLLTFLEHIAEIPSPAIRSQALAFAMGYLSHIATDIAINPYINTLAGIYQQAKRSGAFTPFDMHFYVELCMEEYNAQTYFHHPLYGWFNQPWIQYIEPAAKNVITPQSLGAQVLDLLASAAEITYGFTAEQKQAFHQASLAGLMRLRSYLAGNGLFRLHIINVLARKREEDSIVDCIENIQAEPGMVTFESAIAYAVRLSERLCRSAISYYASLRNAGASASERGQRRALLRKDLRNWNLHTGYTWDVSFDQEITVRALHNWIHFAHLWELQNDHPLPSAASIVK